MNRQWTKDEAWAWYNARPWICGFNYVPANCASIFDMWQEYRHAERFPAIVKEIEKAKEYGFNAVRLFMSFECWMYQHDSYMKFLEEYLTAFGNNGIRAMIVFGNDCSVPKERFKPKQFGEQKVDFGYHGGIAVSPHAGMPGEGYLLIDEPELLEKFVEMVREIVTKYAQDDRVEIWDVFNELGNGRRRMKSVPAMERLFATIRACDPKQPLTACTYLIPIWAKDPFQTDREPLQPWERRALELSDVISYHDYRELNTSVVIIDYLKKEFDRPLFNTEWLHRIQQNCVQTHLPLFYLERIGCYNWGFVAGLNQTYEPWESNWRQWEKGEGEHLDFTKWQHDLLRPNLRPYDPKEMRVFARYIKLAKQDFEARNEKKG